MKKKEAFTIGHSTRSTQEFLEILNAYDIETVVDIRHYPGSRYCPQFNKEVMKDYLFESGIEYIHLLDLGGRRKADKNSLLNNGWRSAQFRGYADYMQTKEFAQGLEKLMKIIEKRTVAFMCSEAVPWRCHRSMVADALTVNGIKVLDIFDQKKVQIHKLTPFAVKKNKTVIYPNPEEKGELHEL
ncbi:MAG TPA: DUF488 domain-containing protein [Bacteriovoracaceae bacterium]|nr:DUF488 domain-containing protein [Bacteriovoracaceae bacterium]